MIIGKFHVIVEDRNGNPIDANGKYDSSYSIASDLFYSVVTESVTTELKLTEYQKSIILFLK